MQMQSRIHPDALHLGQLLRGGIQNAHQGTKLFNKAMRQHIGIPARHRIEQQQFQYIMGWKTIQAFGKITFPQAVTMSGMLIGHANSSPFDKILLLSYHSHSQK